MVARNNSQVMPFLSASDARNGTRTLITETVSEDLRQTGRLINYRIQEAIANKQMTITVGLAFGFPSSVLKAMKRTFQKKGFLVKIDTTQGLFDKGLVWQPRTYITLSWF